MINNNIDMLKAMTNIFDYSEYESKCKEYKVPINSLQQYCIGVGALMVGRANYPHLDWQESYSQTFKDMNAGQPTEDDCCDEKPALPSLLQQAKKFGKTMADMAKEGFPTVGYSEYKRRLAICGGCEALVDDFMCTKCGCYMKVKARFDIKGICELNKW